MQLNDVATLVKLLDKSTLTEISFSDENSKVVLKKEVLQVPMQPMMMAAPMAMPAQVQPAAPIPQANGSAPAPASSSSSAQVQAQEKASKFKEINSPMVGTFYASATPGAPALTQVGTAVKAGQVLCIIEAMKIMNEIEADMAGIIEEVCVTNETPVEYGTVLFRIRPA